MAYRIVLHFSVLQQKWTKSLEGGPAFPQRMLLIASLSDLIKSLDQAYNRMHEIELAYMKTIVEEYLT